MQGFMLTARKSLRSVSAVASPLGSRISSALFSGSYERAERDAARVEAMNDPVPEKARLGGVEDMDDDEHSRELADKMKQAASKTGEFVADAAAESSRKVAETMGSVGETMAKIKDSVVGDEDQVKGPNRNEWVNKTSAVDDLRSKAGGYDQKAW